MVPQMWLMALVGGMLAGSRKEFPSACRLRHDDPAEVGEWAQPRCQLYWEQPLENPEASLPAVPARMSFERDS